MHAQHELPLFLQICEASPKSPAPNSHNKMWSYPHLKIPVDAGNLIPHHSFVSLCCYSKHVIETVDFCLKDWLNWWYHLHAWLCLNSTIMQKTLSYEQCQLVSDISGILNSLYVCGNYSRYCPVLVGWHSLRTIGNIPWLSSHGSTRTSKPYSWKMGKTGKTWRGNPKKR